MIQVNAEMGEGGLSPPKAPSTTTAQFIEIPEALSYPTGSLDFLVELQEQQQSLGEVNNLSFSRVKLNIIIVGAGLGGLAAAVSLARRGHQVTVCEQAPELGEVGAGIQMPPNSNRLLLKWGLGPFIASNVVEPGSISFRRWKDGDVIGYTKLVPEFQENFAAPYYVIHRAHFHDALFQLASYLGVEIKLDSRVVDYDDETPSITLHNGETLTADLIIGVDGVKSIARSRVLGGVDKPPLMTGFAAYRATVDTEKIKSDPDTAWLLDNPGLNLWIGDMRHVMSYTIAAGKSFNIVLSHPDHTDPSTWDQRVAITDMKSHFKGWDPKLRKIIDMIQTTLKWPLLSGTRLDRWVTPSGKFLIMGDAAHAMVPYMSQGAAMAVEDAAALAEAIDQVDSIDDLPAALKVWESVRIQRSSQMQEASLVNGKLWHFADGPEQQARDAAMRPEVEGRQFTKSPNQWSDPTTQRWCYGYDAERVVREAWKSRAKYLDSQHV